MQKRGSAWIRGNRKLSSKEEGNVLQKGLEIPQKEGSIFRGEGENGVNEKSGQHTRSKGQGIEIQRHFHEKRATTNT